MEDYHIFWLSLFGILIIGLGIYYAIHGPWIIPVLIFFPIGLFGVCFFVAPILDKMLSPKPSSPLSSSITSSD
jgi:hypothetical protein